LEKSIARWQHQNDPLWIYFLDIDSLKRVNDSLGHATGDAILVEVAERLKNAIGEEAVLGRYGGDEFVSFAS
jgi:diguanylate cyclase (GGDEF)-like protein